MKKSKQKLPKWLTNSFKIEVKQELDLKNIIHTALDKYTAKDLLEYIFCVVTFDGLTYGMSMIRLLAQEKDVERVKSMILLKYMLDNWNKKEFSEKAAKHFGEAMKKAEENKKKAEQKRK